MLRTALAVLLFSAAPVLAEGVEVHDAYAITALPGARSGAAFMVIHNHGGPDDRLLAAISPAAERVEIHTHVMEDGIARMVEVEEPVLLPADGEIVMERGGLHVMFLGLADTWEDGDIVPVTLMFEVAGEVAIEVPVDLDRLGGGHGMGHGAGHGAAPEGHQGHGAGHGG
jgi:copper(I)-binding protein